MTQPIGLVQSGLDLLLDGERQLERHRRDGLDEQRADGGIDRGAHDALAQWVTEEATAPDAHVVRDEVSGPACVVVNVHPLATEPAHGAALQEARALAGRRLPEFRGDGFRRRCQAVLDALVLLPGDVRRVRVTAQREPGARGKTFMSDVPIGQLT